MSETLEDDLKTSLNNNCMGIGTEFSRFIVGRNGDTLTLHFSDLIIR